MINWENIDKHFNFWFVVALIVAICSLGLAALQNNSDLAFISILAILMIIFIGVLYNPYRDLKNALENVGRLSA